MRNFFGLWPFACGALSVGIGVFVWLGWLLGQPHWATLALAFPATTVNTALMAILAGTSLILSAPATASRRRSMIGKLCAVAVALIAGLTLAEYLLDIDLGIDQLFATPASSSFRRIPGRPSPQTGTAFLLISGALLAIDARTARGKRPAEILALVSGIIPLTALLGYLFGTELLYRAFAFSPLVGMGIATAVALLALSSGILSARADSGVMSVMMADDSGGFAARQLVASLVAFAAATCLIAIGARVGFYDVPIGAALIVLVATVGGSAFTLRVTRRLSRLDTERAASQEQLRQSRERLELAMRGADLAAWDWNVRTGEVIFSPRWAEMRGYSPEEVRAHVDSFMSGLHPDDRAVVENALADYFEGRVPEYETEHRARTKSGDWIWILDRGKVFERDARGQPVRMVGTELDITARKRLEAEVRLAEAKSSGILSISADAIISMDDRQRITSFNKAAEAVFGYSEKEAIGKPIDMLIPERLRVRHRRHIEQFALGPETARHAGARGMAIVGLRKNGEEFPVDASISKLDVSGTRIFTVSLHDISERQRRENEQTLLAEAGAILTASLDYEKMLPRVAELASRTFADLCLVDLSLNGGGRRLCVVTRDPSRKWICDALMQPPPDRARRDLFGSVVETHRSKLAQDVRPELLVPSAESGMHRRILDAIGPASVIATPLLVREKALGAIAFVRSSKSKVYDATDVRLAEELAGRAALSVENGQLYRSAQQAIKARDDVLGVVAHDLRNPLGTILMQASFLGNGVPGGDGHGAKPTDVIVRAAKRMNRLIQDLLDITRMEAGRLAMQLDRVDTNQLLADVMDGQKPLAASGSLELRLQAAPNLPDVNADRDRLLQVFENLIGNAMKFTQAGGRITIAATPRDSDVLFSVSDTGTGIEAEDVPHLFDRFWQARGTEHEGAGLGLPIVKGIVEAHGGHVWVDSAPLRGSTFSFSIPLYTGLEETAPTASGAAGGMDVR